MLGCHFLLIGPLQFEQSTRWYGFTTWYYLIPSLIPLQYKWWLNIYWFFNIGSLITLWLNDIVDRVLNYNWFYSDVCFVYIAYFDCMYHSSKNIFWLVIVVVVWQVILGWPGVTIIPRRNVGTLPRWTLHKWYIYYRVPW